MDCISLTHEPNLTSPPSCPTVGKLTDTDVLETSRYHFGGLEQDVIELAVGNLLMMMSLPISNLS